MDVNTTTATTIAAVIGKSPERDTDAPPRIQPSKVTNGVLKRHFVPHAPLKEYHAPSLGLGGGVYKECQKNHAASIGGHALDGCGEFMPAPTATPSDPTSLKCAACGCHRNFHRREPDDFAAAVIEYQPHHRHQPLPPPPSSHAPPPARESHSPPPISSSYPHMLLALSGGATHTHQNNNNVINSGGSTRKRFRTKFTQEQKDKMYELAERVGWKMQKSNEDLVNGVCSDIGVERGVFKVWMHNNKNTFAKRSSSSAMNLVSGEAQRNGKNNGEDDEEEDEDNNGRVVTHQDGHHHHHNNLHHLHYNGKSNESNATPANASSSSS